MKIRIYYSNRNHRYCADDDYPDPSPFTRHSTYN